MTYQQQLLKKKKAWHLPEKPAADAYFDGLFWGSFVSFKLLHLGCFIGVPLRKKLRSRTSTPKCAPPGIYIAPGKLRFTLLQKFFSLIYVLDKKISCLATTLVRLQLPCPRSTDTKVLLAPWWQTAQMIASMQGSSNQKSQVFFFQSNSWKVWKSEVVSCSRQWFLASKPLNHLGLTLCYLFVRAVSSALWAFSTQPLNSWQNRSIWSQHLAAANIKPKIPELRQFGDQQNCHIFDIQD